MTETQKTTIKGYVTTLDSNIADGELLDLIVDTVADRVLLYLNETSIGVGLERVIAQIVVSAYRNNGDTSSISRIEDNGQAITYKDTSYFTTASDDALFSGFESLLRSYRRPHVITG